MVVAARPKEIKTLYEKYPELERICPRFGVNWVCVASFKDVDDFVSAQMSNASGYLVVDGKCSEIGSGVKKTRHLFWPESVYVVEHREVSIQDIRNATQVPGATRIILVFYAMLQANGIADPNDFNRVIVFEKP